MFLFSWLDSFFEWGKVIGFSWLNRFKKVTQVIFTIISLFVVVLWLSVFLYLCFTCSYMPTTTHERPVHLSFRIVFDHMWKITVPWNPFSISDCDDYQRGVLCEFPSANFSLLQGSQSELLMRGQTYVVAVQLDMPESPENMEHSMFMVVMKFYTRYGEVVQTSSRTVLMRYKSLLYRLIETLVFLPSYLTGTAEQMQTVYVELFNNFQEDPYRPTMGVFIEVQSKRIRIYRSNLTIHASFSGLRYFLYHWPITSAVFGVFCNMCFMTLVVLVAYFNLRSDQVARSLSEEDEKKKALRDDLLKEKAKLKGSVSGKKSNTIEYISSSAKSSKSQKAKLNFSTSLPSLREGTAMGTSVSSTSSFGSIPEDVTFSGAERDSGSSSVTGERVPAKASLEGSAGAATSAAMVPPQIRVAQYSSPGTDASDLRFRHGHA